MQYAHSVGMQPGELRLPNCPAPLPLTAQERTSRALLPAWGHGHSRLSSRSSQQAPLLVPMDDAPSCSSPQHSLAAAVSGGSVGRMTPRTRNSRNSKATAATAATAAAAAALLDHPIAHSRRSSQHVSMPGYTPPSEPLHAWLPSSSASHAVTARTSSDPRPPLPPGGELQPQLSQGVPAALPKRFSFQGGLDSRPSQTAAGAGGGSGGLRTRTSVGAIGLQHRGDPAPDLALTPRQDAAFDVPRLVGLPQERQQLLRMLGIAVREPSAALAQLAPRTNAMPGGSPTLPESGGLAAPGANAGGLGGAEGMLLARRTPAVSDMLAVTGVGAQLELQAHVRRTQDGTAAAAEARAASGSRAGSGSSAAGDRRSGTRHSCNSRAAAVAAAAERAMPSAIVGAEGHTRRVGSTLVSARRRGVLVTAESPLLSVHTCLLLCLCLLRRGLCCAVCGASYTASLSVHLSCSANSLVTPLPCTLSRHRCAHGQRLWQTCRNWKAAPATSAPSSPPAHSHRYLGRDLGQLRGPAAAAAAAHGAAA